jgi:hypothetical protein
VDTRATVDGIGEGAGSVNREASKAHRRWKRRTALVLILVIGCGVWMASGESETVRNARKLRIGMTEAEVFAIMGRPKHNIVVAQATEPLITGINVSSPIRQQNFALFASPVENTVIEMKNTIRDWLVNMGIASRGPSIVWPVQVIFGDGRVEYIRRGSEVVGR